jgi:hypothetical protein
VVRPPRKAKKKKNEKMGLGFWGWPDHPEGPGGGFDHPLRPVGGVFFFFLAFRGGRTTPKGLGWLQPPPYSRFGHPLAKNGVVRPPYFWARGGSSHPAIPPSFFFPSFSQKKKKKLKPKIPKTTPFWAKRRRFG